ncbi:MAG: DUF4179 domain-containing protein [Ruminococcus flavefaciens]|nr:DUF4179 domain-containing protein [Ruminococcus flavefaciens]
MENKMYDLLNNATINFDEYEVTEMSFREKERLKKKISEKVSSKKRNRAKWKFAGVAAAACIALSVLIAGGNYTVAKEKLSETYQTIISGLKNGRSKDAKEFAERYTKIGQESKPVKADVQTDVLECESAGVTMQVSDVYCDDYMLYYTLVLKTDHPVLTAKGIDALYTDTGEIHVSATRIRIDGEESRGDIIRFGKEADGSYTTVQDCNFYGRENPKPYQNGDVIPVEITITELTGWDYDHNDKEGDYVHTETVEGEWKLSFHATVDTSENMTQMINKEKNGVKIVKAVRTRAGLNLEIELPDFSAEPFCDPHNDPDKAVVNEKGEVMQWLSGSIEKRGGGRSVLYLSLLDDGGEDYTLEITDRNGEGRTFAEIKFKVKR